METVRIIYILKNSYYGFNNQERAYLDTKPAMAENMILILENETDEVTITQYLNRWFELFPVSFRTLAFSKKFPEYIMDGVRQDACRLFDNIETPLYAVQSV